MSSWNSDYTFPFGGGLNGDDFDESEDRIDEHGDEDYVDSNDDCDGE